MGYSVQLVKGEVVIRPANMRPALDALRLLDRTRDDLKSGWSRRGGNPQDRELHWAFIHQEEVAAATTLVEMLQALRFRANLDLDGAIYGVELIDPPRNRGNEYHFWQVLAPFVDADGEMIWLGEDDRLERWRFDGVRMAVSRVE